jgi:hypothetical protein
VPMCWLFCHRLLLLLLQPPGLQAALLACSHEKATAAPPSGGTPHLAQRLQTAFTLWLRVGLMARPAALSDLAAAADRPGGEGPCSQANLQAGSLRQVVGFHTMTAASLLRRTAAALQKGQGCCCCAGGGLAQGRAGFVQLGRVLRNFQGVLLLQRLLRDCA